MYVIVVAIQIVPATLRKMGIVRVGEANNTTPGLELHRVVAVA